MARVGDVDLVLAGGLCVTCNESGDITAGDIYVDGGRIVAIGGPPRVARRHLDASGTIIMPGLVNLHDHLVHRAGGSDVRHVIVDGELRIEDGEFVHVDVEALRRRAMEVIDGYLAGAGIEGTRYDP